MLLLQSLTGILLVSYVLAGTTVLDESCLGHIELLEFRWSVENFQAGTQEPTELINSPSFPVGDKAASKYRLRLSPKGKDNIALQLCVNKLDPTEMGRAHISILDKDYENTGKVTPVLTTKPTYGRELENADFCWVLDEFIKVSDLPKYLTPEGSLEIFLQVERVEAYPGCEAPAVKKIPYPDATFCKSNGGKLRGLEFKWTGVLPATPEKSFSVESDVISMAGEPVKFKAKLEKKEGSDAVGFYIHLAEAADITASYSVRYKHVTGREAIKYTMKKHKFTDPADLYGLSDHLNFTTLQQTYLSPTNGFDIIIQISLHSEDDLCENSCPRLGLRSGARSRLSATEPGDGDPDDLSKQSTFKDKQILKLKALLKIERETTAKLEALLKSVIDKKGGDGAAAVAAATA